MGEKKTVGKDTLNKSYQSLFTRVDTKFSVCLIWQRKLPFIWMLLKGFLLLLAPSTVLSLGERVVFLFGNQRSRCGPY